MSKYLAKYFLLTLPQSSVVEDLQSLVDMFEEGLLTEEQFTTAKELRLNQ